jgi:hypothetical protein
MTPLFRAFRPLGATQSTAVTTSNQTVTLNYTAGHRAIRLVNSGTDVVWINFGGVAAIGTGLPIPAGQTEIFTVPQGTNTYGVLGVTGGLSNLYSTVGEGI